MRDVKGKVVYVGKTINFYQRMSKFGNPDRFAIEEVRDIYFVDLEQEYIGGVEAVLIGIFKPDGNSVKYPYYDKWVPLLLSDRNGDLADGLAYHHSFYLPSNQTLKKFIMNCKYKAFSIRVKDNYIMSYGSWFEWHLMDSKNIGWAEPLGDLLAEYLLIDIQN